MPDIPARLLDRLLAAAEADDLFDRCETCGAWMFLDEPGISTATDSDGDLIRGCWWSVTRRERDRSTCFADKRGGTFPHPPKEGE